MIVSNISVPLMGLADTAMLGHLDNPIYLGAVAIGSNIIALLYWMFGFLRMGTTSVTAQAIGANKPALATLHLSQNIFMGLLFGLGLAALQSIAIPAVLWLIAPEENLHILANEYCAIRIYSAPAVFVTFVAIGWMLGLGNTKLALVISVVSNLLNIGLDYLFIVSWQMDVRGAAIATLIAEYSACIGALISVAYLLQQRGWKFARHFELSRLKSNLVQNADLFLRTLALLLVINFFNAQSAHFGNATLAANAILFQCILFVAFFLDGYALAGETLTAQAIGGRDISRFHKASAVTSLYALFIAMLLSLAFYCGGDRLVDLLTNIENVANNAKHHLVWLVAMPVVSVWAFALDGIFIGAGHTRCMRNAMMLSVCCVFFPIWWMTRSWGNHGLWLAFSAFNLSRGIGLGYAYYRNSKYQLW